MTKGVAGFSTSNDRLGQRTPLCHRLFGFSLSPKALRAVFASDNKLSPVEPARLFDRLRQLNPDLLYSRRDTGNTVAADGTKGTADVKDLSWKNLRSSRNNYLALRTPADQSAPAKEPLVSGPWETLRRRHLTRFRSSIESLGPSRLDEMVYEVKGYPETRGQNETVPLKIAESDSLKRKSRFVGCYSRRG